MKVLTFDLEVENHRLNKRLADPFNKQNYIVEAGWNLDGGKCNSIRFDKWHREEIMVEELNSLNKGDVICGFNIKFDLLWIWGQESLMSALKRGVTIFCGQYAEYLLGGMVQEVQMVSMNSIAEKYGGSCKLDAVKELWEDGYLTSEIPPDMLHDYLVGDGKDIVGDVPNTWLIYQGQVRRMIKYFPKEFRTMFKHRMDGLLATTAMEYNGMYVDVKLGDKLQIEVSEELATAKASLQEFIPELPEGMVFNWNSTAHKSCLIFGGTAKYKKWKAHSPAQFVQKEVEWPLFSGVATDPKGTKIAGTLFVKQVPEQASNTVKLGDKFIVVQDIFVSGLRRGQPKSKKVKVDDLTKPKGAITDFYFTFEGYTKPLAKWMGANTDAYDEPLYSTGADIIEVLQTRGIPFTTALSKHTSLSKDLGTYYWAVDKKGNKKGMLTLVGADGIIHHKLNHVNTVTSRMSSSDPNLQNTPRKDTSKIKQVFRSRFKHGKMAEIDYSQLEIVVQGVLSKDKQLIEDLNNKVDFHCKRLAMKVGKQYEEIINLCKVLKLVQWIQQRTLAKKFSFQRAYGAGVAAIVESTGMTKEEVENLVAGDEKMYPGISKFDRELERIILKNSELTNNKLFLEGVALPQRRSHWDSPTGTRYVWTEGITPKFLHKKGKLTGFSPTERKNYPVQGFGGEIVQTMLGKVFRYFLENDNFGGKILLVNTVHDCLLLDGETEEILTPVARRVQEILESVPQVFNEAFKNTLNITVPFPCETEIGTDIYDMTELHK